MRPLLCFAILIAAYFVGCHSPSNPGKKGRDSTQLTANSAGQHPEGKSASIDSSIYNDSMMLSRLKARFADLPIPFQGLWVNEDYIDEIRQGKSVRESLDTETRCIVIPPRTLQVTSFIFGFHEGGEGLVLAKNGDAFYTYALYNGQLVDRLESMPDGKLQIGRNLYIRAGEEDSTSPDWGILERLLFAGQYLRPDTWGTVVFQTNGKIEGLDTLGWYQPVVDYADFATRVDHIRLGISKHHLNDYGLRFARDTMMIYSIDCLQHAGEDCVLDTLGKRLYTFVKVK